MLAEATVMFQMASDVTRNRPWTKLCNGNFAAVRNIGPAARDCPTGVRSSDYTYIEEGLGVPSGVPCGQHSDIFGFTPRKGLE